MDFNKRMAILKADIESDYPKHIVDTVRRQLEEGNLSYYDEFGDGSYYHTTGIRHGAGYADCEVCVFADGTVNVRIESLTVPLEHKRSVAKLCRYWNKNFKLTGLKVDDDKLVFEPDPFDPSDGSLNVDTAVGLGLSTIHAYASVILALDAGIPPWMLFDLPELDKPDSHADDDDDDSGDDDDDDLCLDKPIRRLIGSFHDLGI